MSIATAPRSGALLGAQRVRDGARLDTGTWRDVAPWNPQPHSPAPNPCVIPPSSARTQGRMKDELLASILPLLLDFPAPMTQVPFQLPKRSFGAGGCSCYLICC